MTASALPAKLALARALGAATRLRGGGTSAPGRLLMAMQPDAVAVLGARLAKGSMLVSATNGKTTTAALAAGIFEHAGIELVHNRAGANMAGGVATALLTAARRGGTIAGELGLFEADEMWLDTLAAQLHPRAVLLGNLFRDQLDRYGEIDAIAERWRRLEAGRLVLNADDPLLADIGRERSDSLYFGLEDDSLALAGMAHAADAKHCRRCGAPYSFQAVYMGHLGHYGCENCGQERPRPSIIATRVRLDGVRGARFQLRTPAGESGIELALPGLYNVYNALAAAALATALDVPLPSISAGLGGATAAFGRAEAVTLAARNGSSADAAPARELRIMLVKNPAGANEVLRTLALEPGEHDLLGVLNDNIADGRDVSWIWDADFEMLAARIRRATCSGTRAAELALRLKYAGVDPARIAVEPDLARGLERAAADRPQADATREAAAPLYALPTYTAMLALRELLVKRGEAVRAWS